MGADALALDDESGGEADVPCGVEGDDMPCCCFLARSLAPLAVSALRAVVLGRRHTPCGRIGASRSTSGAALGRDEDDGAADVEVEVGWANVDGVGGASGERWVEEESVVEEGETSEGGDVEVIEGAVVGSATCQSSAVGGEKEGAAEKKEGKSAAEKVGTAGGSACDEQQGQNASWRTAAERGTYRELWTCRSRRGEPRAACRGRRSRGGEGRGEGAPRTGRTRGCRGREVRMYRRGRRGRRRRRRRG